MNSPKKPRIQLGFVALSLVAVALVAVAYRAPMNEAELTDRLVRDHDAIDQLALLSNHLADAESGRRDYLLTGHPTYRTLYEVAMESLDADLPRVQNALAATGELKAELPELLRRIAASKADLRTGMTTGSPHHRELARYMVSAGRSLTTIDAAQRLLDAMTAKETQAIQDSARAHAAASAQTKSVFLAAAMLACLLGCVAYGFRKKVALQRSLIVESDRRATATEDRFVELTSTVAAFQRDAAAHRTDIPATLQAAASRAQAAAKGSGAAIEISDGENLICRAAAGALARFVDLQINAASTLSETCVARNAPLVCEDTEADARVDRTACRKISVRSLAAAPIRRGDQAVGVLTVTMARPYSFSAQDIAAIEAIAAMLCSVLDDRSAVETLKVCRLRLAEAQQAARMGSWEFDVASGATTWSDELFRMVGLDPATATPDNDIVTRMFTPADAKRLGASLKQTMQLGVAFALELEQDVPVGVMPRKFFAAGRPITDATGSLVRLEGTLTDVTERYYAAMELQTARQDLTKAEAIRGRQTAHAPHAEDEATGHPYGSGDAPGIRDALTGLKSHRYLQERLSEEYSRAVRYGASLSLVMLDVDRFKSFNETFGHTVGDETLKRIAEILTDATRTTDVVARFGGEEFAVLLTETDTAGAMETAERFVAAVAAADWPHRNVTISAGVATLDDTTVAAAQLVEKADVALFQAKAAGRNCALHAGSLPRTPAVVSAPSAGTAARPVLLHAPKAPPRYVRPFTGTLREERPSRRLLEGQKKAA
ncbi:MAG TPA: diguanylate cyclase [Chthonomonadaceae bacterium]|nr:diguanylate cyclase [Chthonomonadaceae bacterium]